MQSPLQYRNNPYPYYAELRQSGLKMFNGIWFASRYEDVFNMLCNKDFSVQVDASPDIVLAGTMARVDSPDHDRLRGVIKERFTIRAVSESEHQIKDSVSVLIASFKNKKKIEFNSDFSSPLVFSIVLDFLGIPQDDRVQISKLCKELLKCTGLQTGSRNPNAAILYFRSYFRQAISNDSLSQNSRFFTQLVSGHKEGLLSEKELAEMCILMLFGGLSTMQHILSTGLLTLLQRPDSLERILNYPELMPQAVEEMFRYESPTSFTSLRVATKAIQLGSVEIPAGDKIIGLTNAANRDPAVFTHPDCFDIDRHPNKHIAFGVGAHKCLGIFFARSIVHVALLELLQAIPTLRLSKGFANIQPSYTWIRDASTRGVRHLFLTW